MSRDEARVFAGATALLLLHAMDDAFVHRGAGLGLGQHALAAVIAAAAGVGAVLAFERLRPGLRAFLAFAFGGLGARQRRTHLAARDVPRRRRRRRDGRARGRRGRRAARARRGDPVAAPRRRHLAQPPGRPRRRVPRLALRARAGRARDRRDAQVARAGRRAAERRLPGGALPRLRRARARRLVPAVGERRGGARRARRQLRPQGLRRARVDARPPRLRRAALRRPRARRERGHREQLRLGLGQGRRRRARFLHARDDVDPIGSRRSASRPAPTSCSRSPASAATTSPRSSPTARPPARSRTGTACAATSWAWSRAG